MEVLPLTFNVKCVILGIYAFMILFRLVIFGLRFIQKEKDFSNITKRINSFWVILLLFTLAILVNKLTSFLLVGIISFLALREYLSLIPTRGADRRVLFWVYLSIPIQLLFLYTNWLVMFYLFIPLYMFLVIPLRMVTIGETEGFLRAAGTIHWGLMATVYSLGYLAAFLILPLKGNPQAGGIGLFICILVLTVINDFSQMLIGKTFGKHKIIPKVSPNKTWEGFLGGLVTTTFWMAILAPVLTPLNWYEAIAAGLLISASGFVGDVTMSALKRDIGVKDSGTMLPGHGGILDRLDSLIFTAPLFFHYTVYLHFNGFI
jgi:phosphatidate cytidylyltransferase